MKKQRVGFQKWIKDFLYAAGRSKGSRMYFGTLGGHLFENVAIRALAGGGTFKIRSQPGPHRHWWNWGSVSTTLNLDAIPHAQQVDIVVESLDMARALHAAGVMPTNKARVSLRAHLGLAAGAADPPLPAAPTTQFGIPSSPTFPAIDAFVVQPPLPATRRRRACPAVWRLFQMKNVAEDGKREIKIVHLNRFLTYIPAGVTVELYQVVPMPHWKSAKVNAFTYRDAAGNVVPRPAAVDEYVLVIPDDIVERA